MDLRKSGLEDVGFVVMARVRCVGVAGNGLIRVPATLFKFYVEQLARYFVNQGYQWPSLDSLDAGPTLLDATYYTIATPSIRGSMSLCKRMILVQNVVMANS